MSMIEDFAFVFAFVSRLHPLRITFVYHFWIRITFVSLSYHVCITFESLSYHFCITFAKYYRNVSLSCHFRIRISNSFRISHPTAPKPSPFLKRARWSTCKLQSFTGIGLFQALLILLYKFYHISGSGIHLVAVTKVWNHLIHSCILPGILVLHDPCRDAVHRNISGIWYLQLHWEVVALKQEREKINL